MRSLGHWSRNRQTLSDRMNQETTVNWVNHLGQASQRCHALKHTDLSKRLCKHNIDSLIKIVGIFCKFCKQQFLPNLYSSVAWLGTIGYVQKLIISFLLLYLDLPYVIRKTNFQLIGWILNFYWGKYLTWKHCLIKTQHSNDKMLLNKSSAFQHYYLNFSTGLHFIQSE